MKPALLVFCCAVAAAWVLPRPLGRLSGPGVSPRLGIAAWLAAMTSVLALALAALGLLARTAIDGWPAFARTVCESVTAGACPPAVYRSAAYELGLALIAFLGGITMIVLGWRYGRSLRRVSTRTRAHAEAARIAGHPVGGADAAFVLDAAQPAVYCVPGRPPAIVLTTGALAVLEPDQLTAVLAHERGDRACAARARAARLAAHRRQCRRRPRPAPRRPAASYPLGVPRPGAGRAHPRDRRRLRARAGIRGHQDLTWARGAVP